MNTGTRQMVENRVHEMGERTDSDNEYKVDVKVTVKMHSGIVNKYQLLDVNCYENSGDGCYDGTWYRSLMRLKMRMRNEECAPRS
jgi:CO dehydrogenase nickel-insertion accessory protein CooC1